MIKWAGGKSWLVDYLKPTFPLSCRLVEPFAGSLAISLGLEIEFALLNDINLPLITFLKCIKNNYKFSSNFINTEEEFYNRRSKFNLLKNTQNLSSQDKLELAENFFYLNRTCFNGLYRENSKGEFNVPHGKYKSPNINTDFSKYYSIFKNWEFENVDFELLNIKKDDYLYLDPPYDSEFSKYHKLDFKWEDQVRLINWASSHSGPVVISNQATDRIKTLYNSYGFYIKELEAPRRISCNGDRKKQLEVLAYKNISLF